jgi:hypothetical protein
MSSQKYFNTVSRFDELVVGNKQARRLWQMICVRAEKDRGFKENLSLYLFSKKYSTVFFRDTVCLPFRKKFDSENDWFNAVAFIDSASLRV